MEKDTFEDKWEHIKDNIKWWWMKLSDEDLQLANGNFKVFVGLLQKKYGYTRQRAVEEIDRHLKHYKQDVKQNDDTSNSNN
jgi:uncharacterized protein YjbJ (UPF0337 family)